MESTSRSITAVSVRVHGGLLPEVTVNNASLQIYMCSVMLSSSPPVLLEFLLLFQVILQTHYYE